MAFHCLQNEHYFNEKTHCGTDVVNDLTCTRQSIITRVVYDFYYSTLSTELQRRHMIKVASLCENGEKNLEVIKAPEYQHCMR